VQLARRAKPARLGLRDSLVRRLRTYATNVCCTGNTRPRASLRSCRSLALQSLRPSSARALCMRAG
jgi:hypothetical protein